MKIEVNIVNENINIPKDILEAVDGDQLIARIFFNRGYKDPGTIRQMLDDSCYRPTELYEFPNMDRAVERIKRSIESKELIAVYGDYDVDGVTSTATLVECLRFYTESVIYHVPDRFTEGYGMNEQVIRSLALKGVSLIITCDCGISNINEITAAKDLGMDVIITDHHNLPDVLPPSEIILNPKLLGQGHKAVNISGCGMAWFLCAGLLRKYGEEERADGFLDLLAMSLIADVVSLNGENRYLLKKALPMLFNTKRTGLRALFSIIEKDAKLDNEESVAFQIAPRINAAGRMESARLPVEMLLCSDYKEALNMASKVDMLNQERKRVQQDIIKQATDMVVDKKKNKTVLVLFGESWHHGIIGIAAGKICETYRKPAILLSLKEDGVTIVGSARSTDDINIYDLIKMCSGKLLKFGGHSKAAGLSLKRENLEDFTNEIEAAAERLYYIKDTVKVDVDWSLDFEYIDEELYKKLSSAGPYGEGFEPPVFVTRKATVTSDRKTEKNHHIMVLTDESNKRIAAVKWFGENFSYQGGIYDIIYRIGRNTYKGNTELQLTVEHIMETDGTPKKAFEGLITDERGKSPELIAEHFKDGVFFYEGLNSKCSIKNTINRFSLISTLNVEEPMDKDLGSHSDKGFIKRGGELVFLSVPVNSQIFREVVSFVNPKHVLVNFSIIPDYSFKGFITDLLGILKYVISNDAGLVHLEQLSMRLCIEEEVVVAAVKYLKAAGKIEFELDENGMIHVKRSDNKPCTDVFTLERNIKAALLEKNAYLKFIMDLEAEKFREYLK